MTNKPRTWPMTHELKTWPESFGAIFYGYKRFEVRKNDRDYKVGDVLILKEYIPETKEYSGVEIQAYVTCITTCENIVQYGMRATGDFIIMSIKVTGTALKKYKNIADVAQLA